ncbi:tRNA (guanine37-N1)-methyltransferase [Actinomadura citrea]|uniref:tRNA (guanine-N(1)-)-methyltransferase n=1 Tax=Actinomadura citrea TaxID=46158 RepID=A0A7Y9KAR0_9ACTN|nr:tRNA (guanine37-N1)-methyltransferase [Actinomadura citrea]GGT49553.1 hypothetical protein GCM10010177_01490 [Actinomadura citrea]
MRLDIVTIFPEYFAPLDISLLGKARRAGLLDVRVHDLREWTHDRHRTVDDTPYGGGPGMVMKPDPWGEALDTLVPPFPGTQPVTSPPPSDRGPSLSPDRGPSPSPGGGSSAPPGGGPSIPPGGGSSLSPGGDPSPSAGGGASIPPGGGPSAPPVLGETSSLAPSGLESAGEPGAEASGRGASAAEVAPGMVPRLIIPTPSGRPFTQADAVRYAAEPWLIFACGRYEGIDSRVAEEARTRMPVDEVSLGDFVLAGGEVAVLVMVEAIGRLLPGVLGNADSVADDSFAPGAMESLVEGPVYTKPPVWRERPVPDILLSGHHGAIARWRRDEALRRTARHRPELLSRLAPEALDKHDRDVLREAGFPVDGEDMAD